MTTIITKDIDKLHFHPVNEQLYTTSDSVEDLKGSIGAHDQLTPITITSNNTIISGHRRVKALQQLGILTAECIVKDYATADEEAMAIVAYNKTRIKTTSEKFREIEMYRAAWGRKQGQRTDLIDNEAERISTRDQIAREIGMSSSNVQKLENIGKFAPELLPLIDKGEHSLNSADAEIKRIRKASSCDPDDNRECLTDAPENPRSQSEIGKKKVRKVENDEDPNLVGYKTCTCPECGHVFINQN